MHDETSFFNSKLTQALWAYANPQVSSVGISDVDRVVDDQSCHVYVKELY